MYFEFVKSRGWVKVFHRKEILEYYFSVKGDLAGLTKTKLLPLWERVNLETKCARDLDVFISGELPD